MNPTAAIYVNVPAIRGALAAYAMARLPWLKKLMSAELALYLGPSGYTLKALNGHTEAKRERTHTELPPGEKKKPGRKSKGAWQGMLSDIMAGQRMTAKEICEALSERGEKPAYATVYSYLKRKTAFDGESKRFYMAQ